MGRKADKLKMKRSLRQQASGGGGGDAGTSTSRPRSSTSNQHGSIGTCASRSLQREDAAALLPRPHTPSTPAVRQREPSIRSAKYMEDASFEIQVGQEIMACESGEMSKDTADRSTDSSCGEDHDEHAHDGGIADNNAPDVSTTCSSTSRIPHRSVDEKMAAIRSSAKISDTTLSSSPRKRDPRAILRHHSSTFSRSSSYHMDEEPEPYECPPTPPRHQTVAFESSIVNGRKMISVTDGETSEEISRRNLSQRDGSLATLATLTDLDYDDAAGAETEAEADKSNTKSPKSHTSVDFSLRGASSTTNRSSEKRRKAVEQMFFEAGAIAGSAYDQVQMGSDERASANGAHHVAAAAVSYNAADDDSIVDSGDEVGGGACRSLSEPPRQISLSGKLECNPIAKESGVDDGSGQGEDYMQDRRFYPRTHVQHPGPPLTATPVDLPSCKQKEVHLDREVGSLFALFELLTTSSLDAEAVASVVRGEKRRWASPSTIRNDVCDACIPPDPVIGKPRLAGGGPSAILSASPDHFLSLPPYIQSALLRILIRLLTGEDDDEYYETCLFPHFENECHEDGKATEKTHVMSLMSTRHICGIALRQVDGVTVARFCAYGSWHSKDRFAAVESLLRLYEAAAVSCLVDTSTQRVCYDRHVLGPLARLLGLVATVGISPRQLKRIINLVTGEVCPLETASPLPLPSRLLLLRLLNESAEGALAGLSASPLGDKAAAPHSFFVFAGGSGIFRTVQPGGEGLASHASCGPHWPFKTNWATSIWFRAESFGSPKVVKERGGASLAGEVEGPILLSLRTADGAGIEARLVPVASGAATLTITCCDSAPTPASLSTRPLASALHSSQPQTARLKGCVLTPRVWYHLSLRHTKQRFRGFSLGNIRDEITVILDGKVMIQEALRFPRVSDASSPYTIACGTNFEGQIGSIHVFQDYVSDATLRALFEETAGKGSESATIRTENATSKRLDSNQKGSSLPTKPSLSRDSSGRAISTGSGSSNSRRGRLDMVHQKKFGDAVISGSDSNLFGLVVPEPVSASILDLGEDGDRETCRSELTNGSFKSRLLLVWDPRRISDISGKEMVLDAHSSLHASFGNATAFWTIAQAPKDSIGGIGGVQALLPMFTALLWKDSPIVLDTGQSASAVLVPLLLSILAAFVRGHAENAQAMVRCGGMDIVERCLRENRNRHGQGFIPSAMDALRSSEDVAQLLVFVLNDLRTASGHYPDLYHAVFSRLLFNFALWFGGDTVRLPGVSLFSTLLPELSAVTREEPAMVARCIRMDTTIAFIKELTFLGGDENEISKVDAEDQSNLFNRHRDHVNPSTPLTVAERRHAIDVALGIIITVLSTSATVEHLSPLLNYISHNMDLEWKASTAQESRPKTVVLDENRAERHLATTKACVGLLFLMEVRPSVPGLYESLTTYLSSKDAVCSWILCCLVNTFDDFLRSVGMRLLLSYLEVVPPSSSSLTTGVDRLTERADSDILATQPQDTKGKITKTVQAMGSGLGINTSHNAALRSKISVGIVYKLLWHLLKCHRERIGDASHAAMLHLLAVEDVRMSTAAEHELSPLERIVVPHIFPRGYRFHMGWATDQPLTPQLGTDSTRQRIRNDHVISTFLRLLRFLPSEMKERCLFDITALVRDSPTAVKAILTNNDWQPCLFHLLSESIEEISSIRAKSTRSKQVEPTADMDLADSVVMSNNCEEERPTRRAFGKAEPLPAPVVSRYDLIVKLYASLLGHSIRQGGDNAFQNVEQAASLQRVCVNGHETFLVLLSHVLAELLKHGTIEKTETSGDVSEDSEPLKKSAMIVTNAILSNGSSGLSMASAVRQWRRLRHISAVTVAVITTSGFGVAELFDYRNQHAESVDAVSGGLHGIRLQRGLLPGVAATEVAIESSFNTHESDSSLLRRRNERGSYRRTCVTLASQLLSLLDAFIFPGALHASERETQLHGLALVRSLEPRLGQAQGPLLACLLRLSMVLLSHLEPSSVAFLQCCSRLRCLLHWTLELIREAIVSGGYASAFCVHTAKLDRLVLAVVLQCHSALLSCSVVLTAIDSSPIGKYFVKAESKQRNLKRLLRSTLELREIVVSAFGGRNDVLRTGLSLEAYEELQLALEAPVPTRFESQRSSGVNQMEKTDETASKEDKLRAFLSSAWATGFHDVEVTGGEISIPIMVSNGQVYKNRAVSKTGYEAIIALAKETEDIINDFTYCLNDPFRKYLERQRKWAETDAVYDLEYKGDVVVNRLAGHHRNDLIEAAQNVLARDARAAKSWADVEWRVCEPWKERKRWKAAKYCDRRHRRILLVYNRHYSSHDDACYELMLEKDREKASEERAARLMKKKEDEDAAAEASSGDLESENFEKDNAAASAGLGPDDMAAAMQRARQGIVPMAQAMANLEEADNEEVELVLEGVDENENKDDEGKTGASNWVEQDAIRDVDGQFKEKREEEDVPNEDAWAESFIWAESERPVKRFESVSVIALQTSVQGELLLTSHAIYLRATGEETSVMSKEAVKYRKDGPDRRNRKWRLNRLTEVHGRRFMLRAQALELFFVDTKELFLNFTGGVRERDSFYTKLRQSCRIPLLCSPKSLAPRTVFSRTNLTELWRRRKISNFDYLMHLNIMAGRTFNDLSQYPVFPWILADYTSETLDLNDSRVYRDLSKPVGALKPDRLAYLLDRYNMLDEIGLPEEQKFLYGSHYSSPAFVLHYLIRQEPFTTMHIELQSGRFDCPDRLFFDIAECWKGCNTSTSDVKELIPEFFTCPEMFLNSNGFPLGTTQSKVKVDDVKLPPWAKGSAHEFVRLHRLALESEHVSLHIHNWIDLIFGYKQRGEEATKAHNNFHYLSYEGSVDLDKITDELDRAATETHIQNFGVAPSQLLVKQPHPKRGLKIWEPIFTEDDDLKELRCFTPRKQFGGCSGSECLGAVLSIHPMSDQIAVVFSDLRVGFYQWTTSAMTSASGRSAASFIFKMDRLKALGCHDMSTSPASAHTKEFVDRRNGKVAVGTWSFAMTLGGSAMDSYQRRQASGKTRVTDVPLSALEASSFLISCGYFDGKLKCHVLDSLRLKDSSDGGHKSGINCISMGDDGCLCVTGGQDTTARVWVVDSNDMASALSDEYGQGSFIAKSGASKTESGCILKCTHVLLGHTAAITCLSFSSDLDVVCSGSLDGIICMHNARLGKFIRRINVRDFLVDPEYSDVPCATCSKEGDIVRKLALDTHGTFAAHLNDGKLLLYSINGAKLCRVDAGEKLNAMEICGSTLVTGGESCRVVIRTLSDLSVCCALDLTSHGPIRCISLTPPDLNPAPQYMFVGTEDGRVTIIGRDGISNDNSREGEK